MERHLLSGLRGTCIVLCLLSLALAATLVVGGTGRVLAGSARDGPPGPSGVLLPDLYYGDAHDPAERQPLDTGTANPSGDATLVSLTVTGDDGPISLSPDFDPETTFYTATAEADRVLVEAETTKDAASIVSFTVDDKSGELVPASDKLSTQSLVVEGAVTHYSLAVKAEDGATFETYHILFARPSGQSLSEITIEASRSEYVAGIGPLRFNVARTGDTTSALALRVNFAQDQDWLFRTSRNITIPAGQSETQFMLIPTDLSSSVEQSGDLAATVASVSGYDTSGATVRLRVISQEGPAVTVSFEESEFVLGEGAGNLPAILVARAAPGVPYLEEFHVVVSTVGLKASSRLTDGMPTGDYLAYSETTTFVPTDFAEEDGSLVGRVAAIVTVLDDNIYEGDEQFGLQLFRTPRTPPEVGILGPDGDVCVGICGSHLVTIEDNDEEPGLRLSVSADRINESGATMSTIYIATNNGNSFPSDRTITVTFGGTAVYGDDYTVSPADADTADSAAGHQVILKAETAMTTLTVTAVDDGVDDSREWIEVSATMGGNSTSITRTGLTHSGR